MTATDSGAALRRLEDRNAIVDLVSRLGLWLDEGGADDAGAIFADDVSVQTPGGTASGRDAVVAQATRNHEGMRTQHLMTNVLVDLDGDRATAGANLLATFLLDPSKPEETLPIGGRYRFEAVRTAAGWRLSRIDVSHQWGRRPPRPVPADDVMVP